MKRRRNEEGKGKVIQIQIDYSGPSLSDLPDNVLVNVLIRLTVKRIFVCKCVCKSWFDLISHPHFAKLHFNQAQVYPLIRASRFTLLSRMLDLVQPEHDEFERIFYDSSPVKIKLDSKLKLPLRNIQMIHDKEGVEIKNSMKLNMKNHKYKIVNSCNGLLCLSNPSDNEPVIVCNPVTEPLSVVSFDIEKECFESISVPPLDRIKDIAKMGVLGGELFISASGLRDIRVWAMKDNGANNSWSQIFPFEEGDDGRWPYSISGTYQPIKNLNNGALLIFHSLKDAFICKDPRETGFRYLKVHGFRSEVETIAHIPSFVSLKHALSGHNVEVFNVKSRCAALNLQGEGRDISIIEEVGNNGTVSGRT